MRNGTEKLQQILRKRCKPQIDAQHADTRVNKSMITDVPCRCPHLKRGIIRLLFNPTRDEQLELISSDLIPRIKNVKKNKPSLISTPSLVR